MSLKGFAAFLLKDHLEVFAKEGLRISREEKVPILKYIKVSDEDLMKLIIPGYAELLQGLIDEATDELIAKTVDSWTKNQLPIIEKDQIVTEDISLVIKVRKRLFLSFLPKYTNDLNEGIAIINELEEYLQRYLAALLSTYANLLGDRIEKNLSEFRQSNKLYRQAEAVAKIGNYVWDLKDHTLSWSDEMYRIYEIEPGTNINDGVLRPYNHPDDNAIVDSSIGEAIKTAKPFSFYYRIILKDGREKVLRARGEIEYTLTGDVSKVFGTAQDVTEQKAIEQVLLQKTTELQHSNQSLEEFAFIASHDLKEPLRKISTLTDRLVLIENANMSEDGKLYLRKVVSSSIRMQQMIDDLLSLSQVSADRSFQKVSLNTLLLEVLQTFDQKIEETHAAIVHNELPQAVVVPSQFRQLFQNLISNSLKFQRTDVKLELKISHDYLSVQVASQYNLQPANRYLRLTFSDNGIGFDNKFLPKIFSIFQRLHPRNKYEGTGIGLSICKKIVENHGGVIFANGIVNEGATFTLIIPDNG